MDAPLALPRHCQPSLRKFQISSEKLRQYFSASFVLILASEHPCEKLPSRKFPICGDKSGWEENHSMVQSPTVPRPPSSLSHKVGERTVNLSHFVNIDQHNTTSISYDILWSSYTLNFASLPLMHRWLFNWLGMGCQVEFIGWDGFTWLVGSFGDQWPCMEQCGEKSNSDLGQLK